MTATAPEVDTALAQAADDVFGDVCTHGALQSAEADGWAPEAWRTIAGTGLPWVGVPEEAGGQGGELADALAVLRVAGRHAVPLPLAETGLLGGWLLSSAGLQVPAGPVSVLGEALPVEGGTVHRVPWASRAERLVALVLVDGVPHVASLAQDEVRVEHRTSLSGEPRESVTVGPLRDLVPAGEGVDPRALRLRGALTRVVLMAGAVERLQAMTVQYTSQREQFGKPVGRFQAVQQHLVHVAQQAALLAGAAEVAGREVARGRGAVEVACAKVVADDAARIATRAAHQAHGAMGMTQEYPLHHVTRRLWTWRHEWGDGRAWARWVGQLAAERGADGLYPLIAGGSAVLATR